MDSMLKRVKALTEALSSLRRCSLPSLRGQTVMFSGKINEYTAAIFVLPVVTRCVSESTPPARPAQVEPLKVLETDQGPLKTQSPQSSPKPQPRSSVRPPLPTPPLSEVSMGGSASPVMARRMNTAATVIHPSPPLTPTHGRDSPTVAKVLYGPLVHLLRDCKMTKCEIVYIDRCFC